MHFFYRKGNENHQKKTLFFVHHTAVSAAKRVESVSGRMKYIVLRGRLCIIIICNVPSRTEVKSDDSKDTSYADLERVFLSTI